MAVEHVLGKIKEGKKLNTEDVLVLYLSTIVNELKNVRSGVARLEDKIDKNNQRRRDEQKDRRDDESLSARIDKTNKRIDETKRRIDETKENR
jgi:peptidoglycan hydrolase CwlO-like protein